MKLASAYFVTSVTANRRRLFQVEANADLFLRVLQRYRSEGHFLLHAFVVMPDHVHLLLTPTEAALGRVVGMIKGGFSHTLHSPIVVWQLGFSDRRIRDREEFIVRREYIHQNPVRGRLVEKAETYRYSSAFREPALTADLGG